MEKEEIFSRFYLNTAPNEQLPDPLSVEDKPQQLQGMFAFVKRMRDLNLDEIKKENVAEWVQTFKVHAAQMDVKASPLFTYIEEKNIEIIANQPRAAYLILMACATKTLAKKVDGMDIGEVFGQEQKHKLFGYLWGLSDTAQMAAGMVTVEESFRDQYSQDEEKVTTRRAKVVEERWQATVQKHPILQGYFYELLQKMGSQMGDLSQEDYDIKMKQYADQASELEMYIQDYVDMSDDLTLGLNKEKEKLREKLLETCKFMVFDTPAQLQELREAKTKLLKSDAKDENFQLELRKVYYNSKLKTDLFDAKSMNIDYKVNASLRGRRDYLYNKLMACGSEEVILALMNCPDVEKALYAKEADNNESFKKYVEGLQKQMIRNMLSLEQLLRSVPVYAKMAVRREVLGKLGAGFILGRPEILEKEAHSSLQKYVDNDGKMSKKIRELDQRYNTALDNLLDELGIELTSAEREYVAEHYERIYNDKRSEANAEEMIKYQDENGIKGTLLPIIKSYQKRKKAFEDTVNAKLKRMLGIRPEDEPAKQYDDAQFNPAQMLHLWEIFKKTSMLYYPSDSSSEAEDDTLTQFKAHVEQLIKSDRMIENKAMYGLGRKMVDGAEEDIASVDMMHNMIMSARGDIYDIKQEVKNEEQIAFTVDNLVEEMKKLTTSKAALGAYDHRPGAPQRAIQMLIEKKMLVGKFAFMESVNSVDELKNLSRMNFDALAQFLAANVEKKSGMVFRVYSSQGDMESVQYTQFVANVLAGNIEKGEFDDAWKEVKIQLAKERELGQERLHVLVNTVPLKNGEHISVNYMHKKADKKTIAERQKKYEKNVAFWKLLDKQQTIEDMPSMKQIMRQAMVAYMENITTKKGEPVANFLTFLLQYKPDAKRMEKEKAVRQEFQKAFAEAFKDKEEAVTKKDSELKKAIADLMAKKDTNREQREKMEASETNTTLRQKCSADFAAITEKKMESAKAGSRIVTAKMRIDELSAQIKEDTDSLPTLENQMKQSVQMYREFMPLQEKKAELQKSLLSDSEVEELQYSIKAQRAVVDQLEKQKTDEESKGKSKNKELIKELKNALTSQSATLFASETKLKEKQKAHESAMAQLQKVAGAIAAWKEKYGFVEYPEDTLLQTVTERKENSEKRLQDVKQAISENKEKLQTQKELAKETEADKALKKEIEYLQKAYQKEKDTLQKFDDEFKKLQQEKERLEGEETAKVNQLNDELQAMTDELNIQKSKRMQEDNSRLQDEIEKRQQVGRDEETVIGLEETALLSQFLKDNLSTLGGEKELLSYAKELMLGQYGELLFGMGGQYEDLFLGTDENAYQQKISEIGLKLLKNEGDIEQITAKNKGDNATQIKQYGKYLFVKLGLEEDKLSTEKKLDQTGFQSWKEGLDQYRKFARLSEKDRQPLQEENVEHYQTRIAVLENKGLKNMIPSLQKTKIFWEKAMLAPRAEYIQWIEKELLPKVGALAVEMERVAGNVGEEGTEPLHPTVNQIINDLFLADYGDKLLDNRDVKQKVQDYKAFVEQYYAKGQSEKKGKKEKSIADRLDKMAKDAIKKGNHIFVSIFQEVMANGLEDLSFLQSDEAFDAVVKKYQDRINQNVKALEDRYDLYKKTGDTTGKSESFMMAQSVYMSCMADETVPQKVMNARLSTYNQHIGKAIAMLEPEELAETIDEQIYQVLSQVLRIESGIKETSNIAFAGDEVIQKHVEGKKRAGRDEDAAYKDYLDRMRTARGASISPLSYELSGKAGKEVNVTEKEIASFQKKVYKQLLKAGKSTEIPADHLEFVTEMAAEVFCTHDGKEKVSEKEWGARVLELAQVYDRCLILSKKKDIPTEAEIKKAQRMFLYMLSQRRYNALTTEDMDGMRQGYQEKQALMDQLTELKKQYADTDVALANQMQDTIENLQYAIFTTKTEEENTFLLQTIQSRINYFKNAKTLSAMVDAALKRVENYGEAKFQAMKTAQVRRTLQRGFREYYGKELLQKGFEISAESIVNDLYSDHLISMIMYDKLSTSVSSADYESGLTASDDMKYETLDAYLEKAVDREDYESFNSMSDLDRQAVLLALMLPEGYREGDKKLSIKLMYDTAQVEEKTRKIIGDMRSLLRGKRIEDQNMYHTMIFEKLRKTNGGMPKAMFKKAMAFTKAVAFRLDAEYSKEKWEKLSNPEYSITMVRNNTALSVNGAEKAKHVDKMLSELHTVTDVNVFKDSLAAQLESQGLKKLKTKLDKIAGNEMQMRRLVLLLQNRTILDKSTDPARGGKTVNETMRKKLLKEMVCGADKQAFIEKYSGPQYCQIAMQTLFSYQMKDERDYENREIRRQDLSEGALKRKTAIDSTLLENAMAMLEEIDILEKEMPVAFQFETAYEEAEKKKEKKDSVMKDFAIPEEYLRFFKQFDTGASDGYQFEGDFFATDVQKTESGRYIRKAKEQLDYEAYMEKQKQKLRLRQFKQAMRGVTISKDFTAEEKLQQSSSEEARAFMQYSLKRKGI